MVGAQVVRAEPPGSGNIGRTLGGGPTRKSTGNSPQYIGESRKIRPEAFVEGVVSRKASPAEAEHRRLRRVATVVCHCPVAGSRVSRSVGARREATARQLRVVCP